MSVATLEAPAFDALLPMALVFARPGGRVAHAGPMLRKVAPGVVGETLSTRFLHGHDGGRVDVERMLLRPDRRWALRLVCPETGAPMATRFRAQAIPLAEDRGLLSLSFGADVAAAVGRHGLDARDFAPVDPTVELLFLLEARDAVLAELGRLGHRLSEARDAAELQALTDGLTGLANRRALEQALTRLAAAPSPGFGVMHLDLDHFKQVNDTMGHAAGDRVLERVADILRQDVRAGDLVARVGGDEFVLVFPDCVDLDILMRIGRRIISHLEEPIPHDGQMCRISGSAGITLSSFYGHLDVDRMLSDADVALYASKAAGRAQVSVAQPEQVEGAGRPC